MDTATHIIGRQRIRLRYRGNTDTLALRTMIGGICSDELPARLNRLLDQYDDKDFVLRIDKLDVSLSISDNGDLQDKLARAIIEKVEAALRQKLEQRITAAVSVEKSIAVILKFYLENGYLPWWNPAKASGTFQQALQQAFEESFVQHVIQEILPVLSSQQARDRLIVLLNDDQFDTLILASAVWTYAEWKQWQECFQSIRKSIGAQLSVEVFSVIVRNAVLEAISKRQSTAEANSELMTRLFRSLMKHGVSFPKEAPFILPGSAMQKAFSDYLITQKQEAIRTKAQNGSLQSNTLPETNRQKANSERIPGLSEPTDGIFIGNAGLVLAALYLPALFGNTELLKDDKLTDVHRAIGLLRYLVYEDEPYEEYDLVLEKILCGLALNESVNANPVITLQEKTQVDELLESIIEHWTVLKNTTPSGLRYSFLKREGKLSFQNSQWELVVQKQAHDILLDYLPWNIGMIKLTWMTHMMIVKWN